MFIVFFKLAPRVFCRISLWSLVHLDEVLLLFASFNGLLQLSPSAQRNIGRDRSLVKRNAGYAGRVLDLKNSYNMRVLSQIDSLSTVQVGEIGEFDAGPAPSLLKYQCYSTLGATARRGRQGSARASGSAGVGRDANRFTSYTATAGARSWLGQISFRISDWAIRRFERSAVSVQRCTEIRRYGIRLSTINNWR